METSTIIFISLLVIKLVVILILAWFSLHKGLQTSDLKKQLQEKIQSSELVSSIKSQLEGDKRVLEEQLRHKEEKNMSLTEQTRQITTIQEQNKDLIVQISAKNEKIEQLEQTLKEQKESLEKITEQMKLEFKNISNSLLEEQRTKFKEQSDDSLNSITKPLRENIAEFSRKIEDIDKEQAQRTVLLKDTIQKNSETTQVLANAFSKDKKLQGSWGEHHLEMVLEQSGLTRGREYETEVSVKGQGDLRIDALIKLPEKKHLIIDSKVSIVNYANMQNAQTPEERERFRTEFLKNVEDQIKNLGSKNYQDALKNDMDLRSPEFVFMFMPLESAFSFALNENPNLYSLALQKKVVLCSPTTLFGYLMTVASMWAASHQNDNALLIKKAASDLVKRMAGFVDEISTLEKNFGTAQKTLEKIKTKLNGQQGVLKITKQLDTLGIKNTLTTQALEEDALDTLEHQKEVLTSLPILEKETLWKEESNENVLQN